MKSIQSNISPDLSNFLNFVRWIAALLVVVTHIQTLLFAELKNLQDPSFLMQCFYFLTSLGGEAVMLFFVLSGFLVGGKVLDDFQYRIFIWKDYIIKRVSRLYVVLLPALVIGGILDIVGLYFFNTTGTYTNILHLIPFNYDIADRLSSWTFFSNVFMMQTTLTPQFGSNGPLWSLANEFWYYFIFPFILSIWYDKRVLVRVGFIFVLLFLALILNKDILLYFFVWLMGVMAYRLRDRIVPLSISLILFILALYVSKEHLLPYQKLGAFSLSFTFGMIIVAINRYRFNFFKAFNDYFADFSYTLYLFHDPLLIFLFSLLSLKALQEPTLSVFLLSMTLLITLYAYSAIMHNYFEKNTKKVRNLLLKKFTKQCETK